MRRSSNWALRALILGSAFGCAVVAAAQTGGWKTIDPPYGEEVSAAADFAVGARREQEGVPLSLVAIAGAEYKMAAGKWHRLCLEVKAGDETDAEVESQYAAAEVFRNLQGEHSLKSWEANACSASGSDGHHASPSRSPRPQSEDELRTPAEGSAERQAIMDAVRAEYEGGDDKPSRFKVNYLKAHKGWAWINVTPLNADGNQVGEEAPLLFQSDNGKWASRDLNDVGLEGEGHEGPHDPSPKYIKALQKKYPGMPTDIIPKRHK